nr:MAG TPA: hypothetical protein [Caudoviricetes sp.]
MTLNERSVSGSFFCMLLESKKALLSSRTAVLTELIT